jgi:hypothetical protein
MTKEEPTAAELAGSLTAAEEALDRARRTSADADETP